MKKNLQYLIPALALAALFAFAAFTSNATAAPDDTATPTDLPEITSAPTDAPTSTPPPVDFLTADLSGQDAATMETLLSGWGLSYYKPDGKWGADDAYDLTLFELWAKLAPTGLFDSATRQALLATWTADGTDVIIRTKLPLEGKFIGVNAGHQLKADYGREPLSPEANSPKKARVSSGTQGISTRVPEYKVNLQVALKLQTQLIAQGARVLMVRTINDVHISNVERCKSMNEAGVNVYISLHCDGNNNHKTHGLHTLIPAKRGYQTGTVLADSQLLAKQMQAQEIKSTGAKDKGFSTRRDLSSFNWSKVPTCLIEMGFMTYKAEDKLLVTDASRTSWPRASCRGSSFISNRPNKVSRLQKP